MWGVTDESSENPLAELWGLFKRDDDVSWQHKALCSQTDPEAFFPEKAVPPGMRRGFAPSVKSVNSAWNGPSTMMSVSVSGAV